MNTYTITVNNKKHKVSLESFLLFHSWNDPTFIKTFNASNQKVFSNLGQNVLYEIDNYIPIHLIKLQKNSGCTMITPMNKKNKDSYTRLNDIWTNNKMLVWYLSYKDKYHLLDYRKKIIKEYCNEKNKKRKSIHFTKNELSGNDLHKQYMNNLLVNRKLHDKMKAKPKYLLEHKEKFFSKTMKSACTIEGIILDTPKLYLIIPPKPSTFNVKDVIETSECITDILTNDIGDVTMIWTKEIKDKVKYFRSK